jgi:hypothetical protein
MDHVIRRLRASKERIEKEQHTAGQQAGREWAADVAEADELQRLARARARHAGDWDEFFRDNNVGCAAPARWVCAQLNPCAEDGGALGDDFWQGALGDAERAAEDPMFVKGFCEGALSLWTEIEGQL